jgi:hypothetical protein
MVSTLQYQTAAYMVWWTKQYGTQQEQYDAARRLRDLQRGTS